MSNISKVIRGDYDWRRLRPSGGLESSWKVTIQLPYTIPAGGVVGEILREMGPFKVALTQSAYFARQIQEDLEWTGFIQKIFPRAKFIERPPKRSFWTAVKSVTFNWNGAVRLGPLEYANDTTRFSLSFPGGLVTVSRQLLSNGQTHGSLNFVIDAGEWQTEESKVVVNLLVDQLTDFLVAKYSDRHQLEFIDYGGRGSPCQL